MTDYEDLDGRERTLADWMATPARERGSKTLEEGKRVGDVPVPEGIPKSRAAEMRETGMVFR